MMAEQEVSKKMPVYRILLSPQPFILEYRWPLWCIAGRGSFYLKKCLTLQGYAQELQAEMNQELLDTMHQTEVDDWGRFGKIRQAEEKRLRDPDDVFIHAEERRQQLRRKKRKE
jgi:hypothetical protein